MLENKIIHYLTPNRRLASSHGMIALDDWLLKLWDELEIQGLLDKQLLNPQQAMLKWESLVEGPLVSLAREAWELTHRWLDLEKINVLNLDHEAFLNWAHQYELWLAEKNYVDPICIEKALLPILQTQTPQQIVLFGFESLAPSFLNFFKSLQALGWEIKEEFPTPLVPQSCKRVAFANQKEEIQALITWANEQSGKVGIVVPNLSQLRSSFENNDFNISAGLPLADYPIIQAAFQFLKLGLPKVLIQDFAVIVTSAFSKKAFEEEIERAKLIPILKNIPQSTLSLAECMSLSQGTLWPEILDQIKMPPRLHTCYQWGEYFRALLKIIGWPGDRTLTSSEYQVVQRWHALLDDFSQCDEVLEKIGIEKALSVLEKMARKLSFQPEKKEANVHVLGILEAAGLQFDALWIMGMDNETWPTPCSPNPFIPYSLQREHQLPRSSAEREWHYAKKMTDRFKQSAQAIVFSYALQADGKSLGPSKLIEELPLSSLIVPAIVLPRAAMELFTDDQAPEIKSISATASTLTAMAACPFKAFAAHRLKIRTTAWSTQWLQPFQRGILIHGILETLCRSVGDRRDIIKNHLTKMIHRDAPQIYFEAEFAYLNDVVEQFIEAEKNRAPFEILATEISLEKVIADVTFKLRLDRVDKIAGEVSIIDYKTGNYALTDPQFALYLLAAAELNPTHVFAYEISPTGCQQVAVKDLDTTKIIHLVQQFKQGDARVAPSEGNQTCQRCEMGPLCRVRET